MSLHLKLQNLSVMLHEDLLYLVTRTAEATYHQPLEYHLHLSGHMGAQTSSKTLSRHNSNKEKKKNSL